MILKDHTVLKILRKITIPLVVMLTGLANTLLQTAFLRPKLKSKKVKKLYFSGQLTVPGPGVPPAIVSGKLVANIIKNEGII